MCRFIAFVGVNDNTTKHILDNLIKALVKSSVCDPYLTKLGARKGHNDGWGFVLISYNDHVSKEYYYRNIKPISQDEGAVNLLRKLIRQSQDPILYGIFHVRAASPKEKVSLENTQPLRFLVENSNGFFYLAHNGLVDKWKIAKLLNLEEDIVMSLSDSYHLGLYFSKNQGLNSLMNICKQVIKGEIVKSALNTALLHIGDSIKLYITSYYKYRDQKVHDYYKLYRYELDSLAIYSSSTMVDYYLDSELRKEWIELANGILEKVHITESRSVNIESHRLC